MDEIKFKKYMLTAHKAIFGSLVSFGQGKITTGFGDSKVGITGIIEAYREANLALEVGRHFAKSNNSNYFGNLDELHILTYEAGKKKLVQPKSVVSLLDEDLIKTLETFFTENLNITKTANRLKIHRNSISYRLSKIAKLIKLDPRKFDQATTIKIALLANKLLS